jgi:hypothetical protein
MAFECDCRGAGAMLDAPQCLPRICDEQLPARPITEHKEPVVISY